MKRIKLFVIIFICILGIFALTACSQSVTRTMISAKGDGENVEVDEEQDKEQEEVDLEEPVVQENEENEENEEVDEVQEFINKVLEVKGVLGKLSDDELKELVNVVLELELDEDKAILVAATVVLNPSLTVEDVKDLDVKVLEALCDKVDEVVYASFATYKKALKELKEKYAYVDELEDQVYEYVYKLLEDLSDEEFDEVASLLKEAKKAYNEAKALFEAEKEALDILYADVLKNHKEDKGHHGGKGHHYGWGCEFYDDLEDEFEDYYEFYFDEDDLDEFFGDFTFEFDEDALEGYFNDFFNYFGGCFGKQNGNAVKDQQEVRQGRFGFFA